MRQGWLIPVSEQVVDTETFQSFLSASPMFKEFVDIAASPNQFPIPQVAGAAYFRRAVEAAGFEAMNYPDRDVSEILQDTNTRVQSHLDRVRQDIAARKDSVGQREQVE